MSTHNHNFGTPRTAADLPTFAERRKPQPRKRRVDLDGRVFFVGKTDDGQPVNIVERKLRPDGFFRTETYWHRRDPIPASGRGVRLNNRKRSGTGKSIVATVLEMAGVDTLQIAGH